MRALHFPNSSWLCKLCLFIKISSMILLFEFILNFYHTCNFIAVHVICWFLLFNSTGSNACGISPYSIKRFYPVHKVLPYSMSWKNLDLGRNSNWHLTMTNEIICLESRLVFEKENLKRQRDWKVTSDEPYQLYVTSLHVLKSSYIFVGL